MKRKSQRLATLLPVVLLLSGCIGNLDQEVTDKQAVGPNEVVAQPTINQLSNQYYRALITDGKYQLGASASSSHQLNSSGNILAFEEGLMRISQTVFPTDQYFLREGQVIDEETMTQWVSRESATNPEGLNPALPVTEQPAAEESSESTDNNSSNTTQVVVDAQATPIYLAQIMEKDLMTESNDGYDLSGVVIGLAMNSVYHYNDADGKEHTQDISVGEMRERGKAMANTIVGRLRATEQLRSVPIVVGIFRQTDSNETVGGTFLLDGISREGNYVTDWTEHNEYRVALPVLNQGDLDQQYAFFDNFKNQVSNFFPNLNGISGEALYVDGNLTSLEIEIVTQFYQKTEIVALTQYVTEAAQSTLPESVPIEVKITSARGTEAYIGRSANAEKFDSHIFQK